LKLKKNETTIAVFSPHRPSPEPTADATMKSHYVTFDPRDFPPLPKKKTEPVVDKPKSARNPESVVSQLPPPVFITPIATDKQKQKDIVDGVILMFEKKGILDGKPDVTDAFTANKFGRDFADSFVWRMVAKCGPVNAGVRDEVWVIAHTYGFRFALKQPDVNMNNVHIVAGAHAQSFEF
jgi:hypothetical protein